MPGQINHIQSLKKFKSQGLSRDESGKEKLNYLAGAIAARGKKKKQINRISREKCELLLEVQQLPCMNMYLNVLHYTKTQAATWLFPANKPRDYILLYNLALRKALQNHPKPPAQPSFPVFRLLPCVWRWWLSTTRLLSSTESSVKPHHESVQCPLSLTGHLPKP